MNITDLREEIDRGYDSVVRTMISRAILKFKTDEIIQILIDQQKNCRELDFIHFCHTGKFLLEEDF